MNFKRIDALNNSRCFIIGSWSVNFFRAEQKALSGGLGYYTEELSWLMITISKEVQYFQLESIITFKDRQTVNAGPLCNKLSSN